MCRRERSGQALVEWAVVLPAVLLLTLGIIQFSLVIVAKTVVNHAAYAATRAQLVGEDPLLAARIVCSPVSGTHSTNPGQPIAVPGWGDLPRSEHSAPKTSFRVLSDKDSSVTVEVTHDLELLLPMVDLFFKSKAPQGSSVFVSGKDAGGISYMRLAEKCTLPRLWTKDGDLGLP